MYKKIFLSLLALILIFNFTLKDYADAAIASKAATTAAKQIVKEYVKDKAVETAANFALMEAMEIADKYEAKQGYKVVCPDGSKNCNKPVQVKTSLTDTDKQALKGQAGVELDKLITSGKGMSAWQKFLDWFIPVWAVSFAATAITYALDGEVRSMFNEAAYNALVSLGFIEPLVDKSTSVPLDELDIDDSLGDDMESPDTSKMNIVKTGSGTYFAEHAFTGLNILPDEFVSTVHLRNTDYNLNASAVYIKRNGGNFMQVAGIQLRNSTVNLGGSGSIVSLVIALNGETVYSKENSASGITSMSLPLEYSSALAKKVQSIQTRLAYDINGFWYTDYLVYTVEGNSIVYQLKATGDTVGRDAVNEVLVTGNTEVARGSYTFVLNKETSPYRVVLPPLYDELIQSGADPVAEGNYTKENNAAFVPPAALTYQDETTGETVERVPSASPPGYEFKKPDGAIVPEENVTAGPTPIITPAPSGSTTEKGEPIPEGTPTYTPQPTPSNPTPAPVPLTPTPTPSTPTEPHPAPTPTQPPGGDPPGTGTDEPPLEPFPEGEVCLEKLKFPIFSPLKETFTTAFPFSIPWDIGRAIEAAFGDIGSEKPEYEIKIDTAGVNQTFKITTPAFFDKWKPFTDSFLVFTFDVLIMFGIFRFVKGAGS